MKCGSTNLLLEIPLLLEINNADLIRIRPNHSADLGPKNQNVENLNLQRHRLTSRRLEYLSHCFGSTDCFGSIGNENLEFEALEGCNNGFEVKSLNEVGDGEEGQEVFVEGKVEEELEPDTASMVFKSSLPRTAYSVLWTPTDTKTMKQKN